MSIEQRAHEAAIKVGDTLTCAGEGYSARGHKVSQGRSVKTGRKMKCVRLEVFKVTAVHASPSILPAIIEK